MTVAFKACKRVFARPWIAISPASPYVIGSALSISLSPSRQPRFHILDMASGARQTLLVAHGKGSDPDHSGWVERFSNVPGSEASSAGAYLTGALYEGKHGRSRRLIGLDDSNSNAEARALVIHGAWYVSAAMARDKGKLGRSQGCLAVADGDLDAVLSALVPGCLIYVDKV